MATDYVTIAIVGAVLAVAVFFRLYMMRQGRMRAKCPKCGAVFDASRSFSGIHIGPLRQLGCPACGKTSFMNSYVKDPLNYPAEEPSQQEMQLSQEELEQKHIEESKYEKT
jgi:ribosomal protein S27AE